MVDANTGRVNSNYMDYDCPRLTEINAAGYREKLICHTEKAKLFDIIPAMFNPPVQFLITR